MDRPELRQQNIQEDQLVDVTPVTPNTSRSKSLLNMVTSPIRERSGRFLIMGAMIAAAAMSPVLSEVINAQSQNGETVVVTGDGFQIIRDANGNHRVVYATPTTGNGINVIQISEPRQCVSVVVNGKSQETTCTTGATSTPEAINDDNENSNDMLDNSNDNKGIDNDNSNLDNDNQGFDNNDGAGDNYADNGDNN